MGHTRLPFADGFNGDIDVKMQAIGRVKLHIPWDNRVPEAVTLGNLRRREYTVKFRVGHDLPFGSIEFVFVPRD